MQRRFPSSLLALSLIGLQFMACGQDKDSDEEAPSPLNGSFFFKSSDCVSADLEAFAVEAHQAFDKPNFSIDASTITFLDVVNANGNPLCLAAVGYSLVSKGQTTLSYKRPRVSLSFEALGTPDAGEFARVCNEEAYGPDTDSDTVPMTFSQVVEGMALELGACSVLFEKR